MEKQVIGLILEKIDKVRKDKKITLKTLSQHTNKEETVLCRILNGKYDLDLLTYLNICECLDVSPSKILNDCLRPKIKIIELSEDDKYSFENIMKLLDSYFKK